MALLLAACSIGVRRCGYIHHMTTVVQQCIAVRIADRSTAGESKLKIGISAC
jgi:hypothetical protein